MYITPPPKHSYMYICMNDCLSLFIIGFKRDLYKTSNRVVAFLPEEVQSTN